MRCCTHYSPSSNDTERHDGLQINDAYKFDKPLMYPSCTNKDVVGDNPFGGCVFAATMDKCNWYTPEEPRVLRAVAVERPEHPKVEIRLEIVRVTFGIVTFQVTEVSDDSRKVLHNINAHEHAAKSREIADDLFLSEVKNLADEDGATTQAVELTEDNTNSYLLEVTHAV